MPSEKKFYPRIGSTFVALSRAAAHLGLKKKNLMVLGYGKDESILILAEYPPMGAFVKESERYVILPTGAMIKAEAFLS